LNYARQQPQTPFLNFRPTLLILFDLVFKLIHRLFILRLLTAAVIPIHLLDIPPELCIWSKGSKITHSILRICFDEFALFSIEAFFTYFFDKCIDPLIALSYILLPLDETLLIVGNLRSL
jgi:hypothetical protein